MSEIATLENAELAYDAIEYEGTQAQLAGRLKSACCRQCGGVDGMDSVHRETLVQLTAHHIALLAPWYRQPGNSEYLFRACDRCNRRGVMPIGYERVRIIDIPGWLGDTDIMQPDYEALAVEQVAATAGEDSRASAGLEG
jgi:hypothetical protein